MSVLATLIALALGGLIYLSYRARPNPLPGIPHSRSSARRAWGDLPSLLAHYRETGELTSFAFEQCRKLGSPVAQLFLWPLARRPVVVLDDPRETEDVLLRRTEEFGRPPASASGIASVLHPLTLEGGSMGLPEEAMSERFLQHVLAPRVHRCAEELVELWKKKCELSRGRPFEVLDDILLATFDAVWAALLGKRGTSGLQDEIAAIAVDRTGQEDGEWDEDYGSDDLDQPVQFRGAARSAMYSAAGHLSGNRASIAWSLFPGLRSWFLWLTPQYRYYKAARDREIGRLVAEARKRVEKDPQDGVAAVGGESDTCLLDLVVRRPGVAEAKAASRSSASNDRTVRKDLSMLFAAVHETTAIALAWAVKILTNHRAQQFLLREALRAAFPTVSRISRPSVTDILTISIPYLDATLEEILRLANPIPFLSLAATIDTTLLGCPIPKDTPVLCNPQFAREPLSDVPEEARSKSCQQAWRLRKGQGFVTQDLDKFVPDRWLKADASGKARFNPEALTRLHLGPGGSRCFGSELVMQQLRIFLVLLVWNFELDTLPDALNSQLAEGIILRRPQECYVRLEKI
ncbi:hypothetical protein VTJ83DRAFT_4368 [Remersonia thermophila]|uniref:Cytochrome P450 n=1 Tax=Remersonia thermophila TaxID=72144 RepID=A0ABR4D9S6_9PEZI